MADYEFSVSGKVLKIAFAVPKRCTRRDIVFHVSRKALVAGRRGKPALLRGRPLHELNPAAALCRVADGCAHWRC